MVPQQQRRRRRRAALARTAERRLIVVRGEGGFGFTIAGQRPCVVSAVATSGPAERAGLRAGDSLLAVDGVSVTRASHTAVARLVAAAPQAISLNVAPRESQPTDTEDTEPEERARTRRRHPALRRKPPQPMLLHHPGCNATASTSGVNEILQNLSRARLSPNYGGRLECRAVVGYLGTIETPRANSETPPGSVKTAVRRLRQEKRPATLVLLSVLPNVLLLRRNSGQTLAQYARERILFAGCSSDVERRYFGLVISANECADNETDLSHSCHVFAVDPRIVDHEAHENKARDFQISCNRDPVAERCLEFPPSAEYVVGIIRGMYSLPSGDCSSPALAEISKLAIKGDSPAAPNFSRCNRALRHPRLGRRPNGIEENGRLEPPDFVANSPQPSNHSEMTTTSSNSDSGIGFHNDGRNVADRILVVDFAGQPPINRCRVDVPRRPLGLVGSNGFEEESFLSNTTPVVDGFAGQGRPLNHLDDIIPNVTEFHTPRRVANMRNDEYQDSYNYNNHYMNVPSTSRMSQAYDAVYTENECHYERIPPKDDGSQNDFAESVNSIEIYEERKVQEYLTNDTGSVDNMTMVSGSASKASVDSVSMYSSRSHEEARPQRRKHLQASLDDMLVIGMRENAKKTDDDDNFVHPSTVKFKVRKTKLNLLAKTKHMLTGRSDKQKKLDNSRSRTLSASAGDVCERDEGGAGAALAALAASEPDLRDSQAEQSSPFRRWTTGSGAGSSYRHHDHRTLFNKQMSEGTPPPSSAGAGAGTGAGGGVARWSLGLEQLLAEPAGAAAFAHFLRNEFAGENIRFWWSCEQYAVSSSDERSALARQIYSRHLAEGASEPVNVDAAARRAAQLRLDEVPPPADLFAQAQKQIFNVMKFDSYPRFLRSALHAECARADLCGQPLPFLDTERTKLKKSASNASERRRSGGSLIPWRLRAPSRDRGSTAGTAPAGTNGTAGTNGNSATSSAPVVDVLEGNSCSLCRVVLPDCATTVVGVEDTVSVEALVTRLLLRRNLHCPNYDVTRQGDKGENIVVDKNAPSTVLGGKEVRVERRCVVVLELSNRCVSVRCGAQRPLRLALRPVLARYLPTAGPTPRLHAATAAGRTVSLDTAMQELDGQRLIISIEEEGYKRSPSCDTSVSAPERTLARCDEISDCSSIASTRLYDGNATQRVKECRVRAALRPGPALLPAPPEFLENLRETQRQRLGRNETSTLPPTSQTPQGAQTSTQGAQTSPAPRAPPPLPPKPRIQPAVL